MSKSILTVSPEDFKSHVYKISSKNLVSLLNGIYEFKWEYGKNWSEEQICDIERKETFVWAELIRRGYLKKEEYEDFHRMIYNHKKRRRF